MIISKNRLNISLVILSVCFLALGGIFVKLSHLSPISTGMYRVLFSLPLLYPFAKKRDVSRKQILLMMFSGLFLAMDLLLWNLSFSMTTVANANLLANLVPFTIIPASWFFFKQKIPLPFFVGLIITLIGLFLLMKGKVLPNESSYTGDALAFITSIFYAGFLLVVYSLRSKVDALTIMYYSAFGSLIILLPASFIFEGIQYPVNLRDWWPLICLALFSQVLGQGGMSYCLGKITPLLASILVLTQPVISAIYAWFIFHENLSPLEILAMFIILAGIFLSKKATG